MPSPQPKKTTRRQKKNQKIRPKKPRPAHLKHRLRLLRRRQLQVGGPLEGELAGEQREEEDAARPDVRFLPGAGRARRGVGEGGGQGCGAGRASPYSRTVLCSAALAAGHVRELTQGRLDWFAHCYVS